MGKPDTPLASLLTSVLCLAALGLLGCRSTELSNLARLISRGKSTSFLWRPKRYMYPKDFPPLGPA